MSQKEFNWEEFLASDNIAVYCDTEEQAIDFCRRMHEHGLHWSSGESYLDKTSWVPYVEEQCYTSYGCHSSLDYYTRNEYTVLKWSDYIRNE